MMADPPFPVEIPPDEGAALVAWEREHELRQDSLPASHESRAQHSTQEAAERQRVVGELEITVRPPNDSRPHAERLLELLRIELEIEPILVGDGQPVAREASVGDDIAEELVEGDALIDSESAGVLDLREVLRHAELRRQLPHDSGPERAAERSRLQHVAQVRARHAHTVGKLFVRQPRAQVRLAQNRLAGRRDPEKAVVELEEWLVFVVCPKMLRERKSVGRT